MKQQQLIIKIKYRQQGFNLIELMIALTISLIVSMAVFSTLLTSQKSNKTTTSVNSTNQAGAYAVFQLDQLIRNAGAGLVDYSGNVTGIHAASYSCLLHAAKSGQTLLPSASFPAPFDGISGQLRLAPFLINDGGANASDDLVIMAASSTFSSIPRQFTAPSTTSTLNLNNLIGFTSNDRLLIVGNSQQACFISQVQSGFTATETDSALPLGGEYYQANIGGESIDSANQYVINLGQTPTLLMLAVSNVDNHLYQYDLLAPKNSTLTNANPNIFIENVYQLQALYGIDANGDGDLSDLTWTKATGNYEYAALQTNPSLMSRIKAIKVSLILRADARDEKVVTNDNLTVFADTPIPQTIAIDNTHYRYKAFEMTIPIRNSMM